MFSLSRNCHLFSKVVSSSPQDSCYTAVPVKAIEGDPTETAVLSPSLKSHSLDAEQESGFVCLEVQKQEKL